MDIILNNDYSIAWIIWLGFFIAVEGKAILSKKKGDTLSEHAWKWFSIQDSEGKVKPWNLKRISLVAFLTWLLAHLGWGFNF